MSSSAITYAAQATQYGRSCEEDSPSTAGNKKGVFYDVKAKGKAVATHTITTSKARSPEKALAEAQISKDKALVLKLSHQESGAVLRQVTRDAALARNMNALPTKRKIVATNRYAPPDANQGVLLAIERSRLEAVDRARQVKNVVRVEAENEIVVLRTLQDERDLKTITTTSRSKLKQKKQTSESSAENEAKMKAKGEWRYAGDEGEEESPRDHKRPPMVTCPPPTDRPSTTRHHCPNMCNPVGLMMDGKRRMVIACPIAVSKETCTIQNCQTNFDAQGLVCANCEDFAVTLNASDTFPQNDSYRDLYRADNTMSSIAGSEPESAPMTMPGRTISDRLGPRPDSGGYVYPLDTSKAPIYERLGPRADSGSQLLMASMPIHNRLGPRVDSDSEPVLSNPTGREVREVPASDQGARRSRKPRRKQNVVYSDDDDSDSTGSESYMAPNRVVNEEPTRVVCVDSDIRRTTVSDLHDKVQEDQWSRRQRSRSPQHRRRENPSATSRSETMSDSEWSEFQWWQKAHAEERRARYRKRTERSRSPMNRNPSLRRRSRSCSPKEHMSRRRSRSRSPTESTLVDNRKIAAALQAEEEAKRQRRKSHEIVSLVRTEHRAAEDELQRIVEVEAAAKRSILLQTEELERQKEALGEAVARMQEEAIAREATLLKLQRDEAMRLEALTATLQAQIQKSVDDGIAKVQQQMEVEARKQALETAMATEARLVEAEKTSASSSKTSASSSTARRFRTSSML